MNTHPFTPTDIDAILFDMDGTLIDTDNVDVRRWATRIARLYRRPERAHSAARSIVMAMESPINSLFTILDWVGLDNLVVRAMIALQGGQNDLHDIPAIENTLEVIEKLSGHYKLGVVSTRSIAEQEVLLKNLGLREYFDVLVGRDSLWRIKPHPQPVLHAARALGVEAARCLMVGDTTVDILAGRRAGAWTCGVLCGYGEPAELERAGADVIIAGVAELGGWLLDEKA
ncbi:MAG: HAD family hydrolase [Anaerolineae bacterium]|nr:HAD family hydrolase [Anaerolineae bacterium]